MRHLTIPLVLVAGCATTAQQPAPLPATGSAAQSVASAALESRSGSAVTGSARFTPAPEGLAVHLEILGGSPGPHGVHVHEKGDCSDAKAASAGGHFNPHGGAHHGGPRTEVRHGGDLGNVDVDASGKGILDVIVSGLSLDGAQDGVNGKALVVHEKADDLQSDPAGNSGARQACGVIRTAR